MIVFLNMRRGGDMMSKKILIGGSYLVAILFVVIYGIVELLPSFDLSEWGRLTLLMGSCIFLYLGGFFLTKYRKNNKPMIINLWIFFGLYLLLLITLTLFDKLWGRSGFDLLGLFHNDYSLYFKNSINLVPFKTITMYLKQFDSMYDNRFVLFNLLGNIAAFMPFAFFLPLLFKKQNKFFNFLVTILLIVLGIELLQLITASGRFDIDDFILNISGAIIMYLILKISPVKKLIKNIFLCEKNQIPRWQLILIGVGISVIFLILFGIVKYRNCLYEKNYQEFERTHRPIIKLFEDESQCLESSKLFYEDRDYMYYTDCELYALMNNEDVVLVKDVLMEKTEYEVNIMIILERLDFFDIDYVQVLK